MQTPDRAALYARLKLAGLDDAPCQLAVFSDRSTAQGDGARPPHHAGDARLLRGQRRAHASGSPRAPRGSASAGSRSSTRRASPRSSTCRRTGCSSAISASAIRSRTTTRRRWSARAGSIATPPKAPCCIGDSLSFRKKRMTQQFSPTSNQVRHGRAWPGHPRIAGSAHARADYPHTIPAIQTARIIRSPRPLRGAIMRRREAGRGAAPAGLVATRHSGGIGAPSGTTTSPCQELADARRQI